MNFNQVFKVVKEEFDEETAILACIAVGFNSVMTPSLGDIMHPGFYTEKLNAKTKAILWEHDDKVDLVIRIREALSTYIIQRSMNGLGGCKKQTLKEIMGEE